MKKVNALKIYNIKLSVKGIVNSVFNNFSTYKIAVIYVYLNLQKLAMIKKNYWHILWTLLLVVRNKLKIKIILLWKFISTLAWCVWKQLALNTAYIDIF